MKHTPEPWDVHQDAAGIIVAKLNPDMSLLGLDLDEYACFMNEEDARRVVACVNACAGIPTDDLEASPEHGLLHLAEFTDSLVAQRDELLAALIESRHALQYANDNPNGGISDTIWMMHRPETVFDFMDAAIAKAKGGAA